MKLSTLRVRKRLLSVAVQPNLPLSLLVPALSLLGSSLIVSSLAGCAVGPDFKSPDSPMTESYTAQPLPSQTAATPIAGGEAQTFAIGKELPTQWWTLFGSNKLDALIAQAFSNSPTMTSARAALREAEENLNAQRGAFFPSVDANGSAVRQRSNASVLGTPTNTGTSIYNLYNASVSVAYTLDIFGGVRRSVEAQEAVAEAQRYELHATYLTLAANVVTSSVSAASLRDQLNATKDIVAAQEKQLEIADKRHQLGAIAYADVLAAQSNLASVRATLPVLEKQYAAVQNQLAVYLGKLPSEFGGGDFDLTELKLPQEIPLSLPAQLVRQRPDVRSAEARLHQASALIGVATADYRLAVLTAYQNVADALTALQSDAQALQAQYTAMSSSKENLGLVERQYALGSVSYINLLVAQRQYQQARVNYSQALASRYQDTAALFQALGGTWDEAALTATTEPSSSAATQANSSNTATASTNPAAQNNEQ